MNSLDAVRGRGIRHHHDVGIKPDQRHRRKIGDRIVIDGRVEKLVGGVAERCDVDGVAVGIGARHGLGGDIAGGAGLVFDHDLLAPDFRQLRRHDPRRAVDRAAGRDRADQAHEARGPGLLRASASDHATRCAAPVDELPAVNDPHSITSSARSSTDVGSSTPIAFAVLRLTTSSNFVGCSTGRSAGLAPLRILAANSATRRKLEGISTP